MARLCVTCGTPLGGETSRFCNKCGTAVAPCPSSADTTASSSVSASVGSTRTEKPLRTSGPSAVVAGILAGLFPIGVGAVYVGQYAKGWIYLLISLVLTLGTSQSFPVGRIALLVYAFYFVWQIIDAVRAAKAMRSARSTTNLSTMKRAMSVAALVLTLVAVTAARVFVEDRIGKTQSADETAVPPSRSGDSTVALASQASANPKDGSIAEDVSFLNRHFRTLDNEAGRLEPTGFSVRDGQIIFEFNDSDPGKPMTHMVYSALAADLDPDSVADLNGSLWVDCKNQEPCVSKPEATDDHKRIIIGPYTEDYSREAKQRFKRILLIQQGQSPEAAAKQSADSHKGEQFWGWNCKDFMRVNTDRNASAELTGPVMVHHQQSISVIVFLNNPQEMAWRSALNRSRYLGGPDKGKLMEDYWESNFTNGAREATLQLSKDGVLCPRCPDDWEGWKFTLNARVPRRDDPTQTDEFF